MSKTVINTDEAPVPIGPYSQSVLLGNTLYVSGQIAINPATGTIDAKTVREETTQVMENIGAILTAASLNFSHIVKSTIFLSDMALFAEVNEVYGSYFAESYPARETVAVKGLPKNVQVEISVIAGK